MRPQPALEQRGAVDHQVMRRDGAGDARRVRLDDLHRLLRGDVLDHHLEPLIIAKERQQHLLHEDGFAVEDIDCWIGRLAVDQHRHADLFHPLQHLLDRLEVTDAMRRIGGGAGGIKLRGEPDAFGIALLDLVGRSLVGEVTRHHRLEVAALAARREDARAILRCHRHGGYRRHQVRHHDAAGELRRRERQHRAQHRAVAQMDVPVVGPPDRQAFGGLSLRLRRGVKQGVEGHQNISAGMIRITAMCRTKSSHSGACVRRAIRIAQRRA